MKTRFLFIGQMALLLGLGVAPCLAQSVTLRNENFDHITVEARHGADQQHVERSTYVGSNRMSKGESWKIPCTTGWFDMYRSREDSNGWSDWTAAFCSGDFSYRIGDGGRTSTHPMLAVAVTQRGCSGPNCRNLVACGGSNCRNSEPLASGFAGGLSVQPDQERGAGVLEFRTSNGEKGGGLSSAGGTTVTFFNGSQYKTLYIFGSIAPHGTVIYCNASTKFLGTIEKDKTWGLTVPAGQWADIWFQRTNDGGCDLRNTQNQTHVVGTSQSKTEFVNLQ